MAQPYSDVTEFKIKPGIYFNFYTFRQETNAKNLSLPLLVGIRLM